MQKLIGLLVGIISPLIVFAGPVDINSADAATIARELEGIGPARARAIVEYRKTYGRFSSAADITNVTGIGQRVLAANEGNILVGQDKDQTRR